MTDAMREQLSRHTFLQLDASVLAGDWPCAPDRETADFALDWFAQQRPAICTRSPIHLPAGSVAAGIATPPVQGKCRIALNLPLSALTAQFPPPTLRSVVETCPLYRGPLTQLSSRADAAGLQLSLFGSFAWQHLTGLPYVTTTSDLDVLWRPSNVRELVAGIELLAQWETEFGLRADGEAILPNEDAVCWREWSSFQNMILVKHFKGARLSTRTACLALLSAV